MDQQTDQPTDKHLSLIYVVASNKAGYTAFENNTRRTYGQMDGQTEGHNLLQRCDGASKKASTTITTIGLRKKRSERKKRRQITRLSVGLSVCYFLQKKLKNTNADATMNDDKIVEVFVHK